MRGTHCIVTLGIVTLAALALASCAPQYPPVPKDAWPPNIPAKTDAVATKPAATKPSDLECREYHEPVVVDGKVQEAYGTVCRQADGSWRITPKNDVPPPPQVTTTYVPVYPAYPPPYYDPLFPRLGISTGFFFGSGHHHHHCCW